MWRKLLITAVCSAVVFAEAEAAPSWRIEQDGGIVWDAGQGGYPHDDHIEMSGESMSAVLRWGVGPTGTFSEERSLVFPMLRTIPNDTHASLLFRVSTDIPSLLSVDGMPLVNGKTVSVGIDGMLTSEEIWSAGKKNIGTGRGTEAVPAVKLTREIFPSMDKPALCERYRLTNIRNSPVTVYIPEFLQKTETLPEKGVDGSYVIRASVSGSGTVILEEGESVSFGAVFQAYRKSESPVEVDVDEEFAARKAFVRDDIDSELVLDTPDTVINTMFRFAKLRASESICKTSGGYMHAPGGESYYAAIWANDQAEYVNPFFPYLGYWKGNASALNSFRHFARFTNPEYRPLPSSIIAEGKDIWAGAGDRGDAAMVAYGAARYLLAEGDESQASELWPLVEWCLEYCHRQLTEDGVVASDTDELEGRFEAGDANLCTSCLYYDALVSASYLAAELGLPPEAAEDYRSRAVDMAASIEKFFGKKVSGYRTYRYYEGNTVLRSWICMPLCVGINDRAEGTADALLGPEMWTGDGLLTEEGDSVFWDRATLYALRGIFCAGESDRAAERLASYSEARLLGEHVPYPVEAYPEGSQRHLSAESGLYCRIITEGLFGIRPAGFESFDITPSMPSGWDRMSLSRIHAFGHVFDLTVSRKGSGMLEIGLSAGEGEKNFSVRQGGTVRIDLAESLPLPDRIHVTSPDGDTDIEIDTGEDLTYCVLHAGDTLVSPSRIGMEFGDGRKAGESPELEYVTRVSKSGEIPAPYYRKSAIAEEYNGVRLEFDGDWALDVRAYDSGVAWRFVTSFPEDTVSVMNETAEFRFPEDNMAWVGYSVGADPYANAFQNFYTHERISGFGEVSPLAFLPLAVAADDGTKVLLSESDLRSYPGMFLSGMQGGYKGVFSGLPDSTYVHPLRCQLKVASRKDTIAVTDGSRTYPWRIVAVADEDRELPENDLVYLLAEPARYDVSSWCRPGLASWEWWNHYDIDADGFEPGINDMTYKAYIDFAAAEGIPYVIMDEGWSAKDDIMEFRDSLHVKEIVAYASEKGVGIILWAVANVLDEKLEEACRYYAGMGVKGFKVDFLDRDDQEAVDMVYRISDAAARHRLILDLHGIYKPTGQNRTFPNILNYESVFGMEELKWSDPDMPEYDVTFPFIRQVQGPVDYTQGAYRNSTDESFAIDYYRPMSQGTRAHQVACYVVFDSPVAMLCDSPDRYLADRQCTEFITDIPTVFDSTTVVSGKIGEYIVTARRKGDTWYVGALTDWNSREVTVPLDFLDEGYSYGLLMLSDSGKSAEEPQEYAVSRCEVTQDSEIALDLAPGGGAAMIITRNNKL